MLRVILFSISIKGLLYKSSGAFCESENLLHGWSFWILSRNGHVCVILYVTRFAFICMAGSMKLSVESVKGMLVRSLKFPGSFSSKALNYLVLKGNSKV